MIGLAEAGGGNESGDAQALRVEAHFLARLGGDRDEEAEGDAPGRDRRPDPG